MPLKATIVDKLLDKSAHICSIDNMGQIGHYDHIVHMAQLHTYQFVDKSLVIARESIA
jgi:hypothetical protein